MESKTERQGNIVIKGSYVEECHLGLGDGMWTEMK